MKKLIIILMLFAFAAESAPIIIPVVASKKAPEMPIIEGSSKVAGVIECEAHRKFIRSIGANVYEGCKTNSEGKLQVLSIKDYFEKCELNKEYQILSISFKGRNWYIFYGVKE